MSSIRYGLQFADTLEKSILVSRLHLKGVESYKYSTLHRIAWKILRKVNDQGVVKKLAGDEMFQHITEALRLTYGTEPEEGKAEYYYSYIRAHKNNSQILRTLPDGLAILNNYQKVLKHNFDWEDSLQTATWYLKNNMVQALYQFPYQNIILVQSDLLQKYTNKNALDFFNAWCTWMEEYTRWNAFLVNNFGYIFKFNNGSFESYGHICNLYAGGDVPFDFTKEEYKLRFALEQQPLGDNGCFF